jgi:hypothetical protein
MAKAFLVSAFLFFSTLGRAAVQSRYVEFDCGASVPKVVGTVSMEFDSSLWTFSCTDLPKESTYVTMDTPKLGLIAGLEMYGAKTDLTLNSGFANRASHNTNSCQILKNEFNIIGVHALFNRFWHPEFAGKFPVSVTDQNKYVSLVLLDLDPMPASTFSGEGTIYSGNQSCHFKPVMGR